MPWAPLPVGVVVPNRHHFDGLNDQFAYGDAASMRVYLLEGHRSVANPRSSGDGARGFAFAGMAEWHGRFEEASAQRRCAAEAGR